MKNILVVDDDEIVQETLKLGLESLNYKVFIAWDEKSVMEVLSEHKINAILLDISLSGVDGITLCRRVKQTPGMAEMPILIITAYGDSQTYHDAYLFGACDYIVKPFDILEISKKIENAIAKRGEK